MKSNGRERNKKVLANPLLSVIVGARRSVRPHPFEFPSHQAPMSRLPRLIIPGVPLHIVQRGHNRSAVFLDANDCRYYRQLLFETSRRFDCAIHAYVLMTNHVHLLVTPNEERGPARMMQTIGRKFVRTVNACRERSGALWEGRYKSMIIASERYFLTCSRYIELNPVRAGLVAHPGLYEWSSYRHNAEDGCDALITEHALYRALAPGTDQRRTAYRILFDEVLDPGAIDVIRYATRRGTGVGAGATTGATRFADATTTTHGGDRRSRAFRLSRARFQQL